LLSTKVVKGVRRRASPGTGDGLCGGHMATVNTWYAWQSPADMRLDAGLAIGYTCRIGFVGQRGAVAGS